MTQPKIETVEINGKRHYVHPNNKKIKVPSVTSIIDMLPSHYLRTWNSKVTAQAAVEEFGYVSELINSGKSHKAIEWLKAAATRELNKAADVGDRVHKTIEDIILTGKWDVDEEIEPYIKGFYEFCDRFEPEWLFVENPIFSVTHLYAGSFDGIAKINNKNVIIDFKTTRSGISAKVAMQLAAYARADVIFVDGEECELPRIDAGAALWLRPDKWAFQPLRIDEDIFLTFLSLRRILEWEFRQSKTALLSPIGNGKLL
jgi:hypothetical protein